MSILHRRKFINEHNAAAAAVAAPKPKAPAKKQPAAKRKGR